MASGWSLGYRNVRANWEHVGHEKRGVTTYVGDDDGYPIVRGQPSAVAGIVDSDNENVHSSTERVVDDDTMKIADAFIEWRRDQ